jgi:PKD repeat protein
MASGGLVFKAAGNDSTETADFLCARNDVLCVAATDQNDCKAEFSTYGSWVDVSAPGVGIWSSWHNADDPVPDYIATMDGTSMATPISASVAALIWSQNPTWTAAQVRQRLFDSADPIDGLACNFSLAGKLGAGRINAFKAVGTASPPTPPVADFSATPTTGETPLTVAFTDQSAGSVTSWSWNFGDGGGSTAQNPTHTYTAEGIYTVSLTVTGPVGQDTESKTNFITVSTPQGQDKQAGVSSLLTGHYVKTGHGKNASTAWAEASSFIAGDELVIRAQVKDLDLYPVGNAVVEFTVSRESGADTFVLTTGPSDSMGIAEAKWKTSAPKGKNAGTTPGVYTATVGGVTAVGYTWDGKQSRIVFEIR